jgi:hypothetical protein
MIFGDEYAWNVLCVHIDVAASLKRCKFLYRDNVGVHLSRPRNKDLFDTPHSGIFFPYVNLKSRVLPSFDRYTNSHDNAASALSILNTVKNVVDSRVCDVCTQWTVLCAVLGPASHRCILL